MCKNRKKSTLAADPKPTSQLSSLSATATATASPSSSLAATSQLSSLRRRGPILYPISELLSTAPTSSSSSSSSWWRCSLRGADAAVSLRPFRGDPTALPARLAALGRGHHAAVARLLGAALSGDRRHLYLAHEFVPGPTLAACLRRSPRNPSFSAGPLPSWLSRVRLAADLAHGLSYIHHYSDRPPAGDGCGGAGIGMVHGRITSSGVIVTDPGLRAKICHFGAAELAAAAAPAADGEAAMGRSDSGGRRVEGIRGYMAPELRSGGRVSKSSDVFAFGVVLLELISGQEPVRYQFNKDTGNLECISLIDTARTAVGAGEEEDDDAAAAAAAAAEREVSVRRWADGRLGDSFPAAAAAEKLIGVALRCVEEAAAARPEMSWVAGKISKLLIDAEAWDQRFRLPTGISVSMAPR